MNAIVRGKPHLTRERARQLLQGMILIRRFEERCAELYTQEKIRGFLHLYIGEEANAVGVMRALAPEDAVVATYREHGHALLRGLPAREVMAEMYGKASGSSHGRGGSMHVFDAGRRFYGGNAIVGGGLPLAVGLALADKMLGKRQVTCCFFGEGAVAEGEFHESLNLASLWKLPVLFVCENNLYAMGTALGRELAVTDIRRHAERYDISAQTVDGMDVVEVEAAAQRAANDVRAGNGPQLLENKTYRLCAHSMFDAQLYRDKAEVEQWKAHDPIRRFSAWALENGFVRQSDLAEIESEVAAVIADAVAFAEAAPWESAETVASNVYTPHGRTAASP